MSAFMVGNTHIDALLTAGLARSDYGPMSWMERDLTDEDRHEAYQRGEPWGPAAIRLYRELRRELTHETAGRVGAMLLTENRRSIDHRYDEEELEQPYEYHALRGTVDPVVVLKAIACYEYQSCEHPEWEASEAKRFCDALAAKMVHMLPGWDDAPWEIDDRDVFMAVQS